MPNRREPCGQRTFYSPPSKQQCLRSGNCCYDNRGRDFRKWCYRKGENFSNLL